LRRDEVEIARPHLKGEPAEASAEVGLEPQMVDFMGKLGFSWRFSWVFHGFHGNIMG